MIIYEARSMRVSRNTTNTRVWDLLRGQPNEITLELLNQLQGKCFMSNYMISYTTLSFKYVHFVLQVWRFLSDAVVSGQQA